MSAAVIIAMAEPLKTLGTSAASKRSRMEANKINTNEKPTAPPKPKKAPTPTPTTPSPAPQRQPATQPSPGPLPGHTPAPVHPSPVCPINPGRR